MAVFTANNLYPGTIDTAMPGFNVEDGQVKIYFNFSQYNDITKIKQNYIQVTLKYQNNNLNALNDASEIILKNWNQDDNGYYFILEDSDLKDEEFIPYQYYKLQFRLTDIAASNKTGSQTIDNWLSAASTISGKTNLDESSEWSTICLIRGITALTLEVEGLTAGGNLQSVSNLDNVIGHVSFTAEDNIENTEYLKTVNLKLYDKDNVLIKDSGEIICDNYKAPNYFNYSFDYKFQKGNENPYKMEIVCITNTLYQETFIYNFYITEENIDFDFSPNLTTITDSETGTIKLGVEYKDSGLADTLKIYRTAATDNYSEKKEIYSGPFVKASESSYEYVNGSGTSISLNNTMQSKMKMSLAPSELEQTTYTGKNLFNTLNRFTLWKTTEVSKTNNKLVLKPTEANSGFTSYEIPASASTQYTVSCDISMSGYTSNFKGQLWIYEYNADNTQHYITVINTDNLERTFTTQNDTIKIRFNFYSTNDGNTGWENSQITYSNIQCELGNTKTSFEPYVGGTASPNPSYPQDIHTISGDNSVVVNGKNLFPLDPTQFPLTSSGGNLTATLNEDGSIHITGTRTTTNWENLTFSRINNVRLIFHEGITYTSTIAMGMIKKSDSSWVGNMVGTFTPSEDWIASSYYWTTNATGTIDRTIYPMIMIGTGTIDSSTFVPYQGTQTAPINLPVENLFDGEIELGGLDNSTGEPISNNDSLRAKNYISVKPNTTYTINNNKNYHIRVYFYGSSYNFISLDSTNYQSVATFTTPNNTSYIKFRTNSGTTENDLTSLWQLEKGTKANSYTPYGTTPIEYCKIGNYEDEFILTSGKNLFDKDNANILNAYIASNANTIISNNVNRTFYISCNENTTYTLSKINGATFSVAYTKELPANGVTIYGFTNTTTAISTNYKSITITTGTGAKYIVCRFMQTEQDTLTMAEILATIQIEYGNQATSYEPYGTNQWYLKKNIGKVVLDGNGRYGWRVIDLSNAPDYKEIYTTLYDNQILWNTRSGLTDRFSSFDFVIIPSSNITREGFSVGGDNAGAQGRIRFAVLKTTASTIDEWKTWLASNNIILYYVLATPTYTQITGTLETQLNNIYKNMLSYKGTTNVSQINNNLSFNITASALKDTSSLLVNPQYLDTSFESGILYKYEMKAVNTKDNLKSKEFETESPIGVMFDHMYLKSGNQQLKIKFNPQINSMKTIYSENKTDTLGSQYPFIKRNAAVKYRTFPISGLISYFMDGEHYFSSRSFEYGDNLNDYNTFNNNNQITSTRDYTYERLFRERVRNFLEDNKVKLFRSPTEGNMLIKLMDINFSPNQSTGRLIWNFSATAYEIDDMTIDNLKKYGIIPMDIDNNFGEDNYINDPALFSYMPHTSEEGSI